MKDRERQGDLAGDTERRRPGTRMQTRHQLRGQGRSSRTTESSIPSAEARFLPSPVSLHGWAQLPYTRGEKTENKPQR